MAGFNLFENLIVIPNREDTTKKKNTELKLKKGETLNAKVAEARRIVTEKLGKYKDTSKCVCDIQSVMDFFNEVTDDSIIGIDTETTGYLGRLYYIGKQGEPICYGV